ncbi:MAG TPA: aldo/keto reductase [Vicinamibacteria bacterium]|nr:aldo/keto reductase [Vicinamibacteria bacterium]
MGGTPLPLAPGSSRLGFGAMGLSRAGIDEADAVDLLHRALDSGIRFIDSADVYAPSASEIGHNERLIAKALASWGGDRARVIVATKGGLRRGVKGWFPDGRARHLRRACEASLTALGVEAIDLYQLHAIDSKSKTTTFRTLEALLREGKVRRLGLCNVSLEELEEARRHFPVTTVQVSLSPIDLAPLKNGVASFCQRHGIDLIAHSPLGGYRNRRRIECEPVLANMARRRGASCAEIALAWLLSMEGVIPIPGATKLASLESSLRARELVLTGEERDDLFRAYSVSPEAASPATATDGEVVLFVGYPGAGKTTAARAWEERGYSRLNRDERGGTLRDLIKELDDRLGRGERKLVLDNTYPRRASRYDVIQAARRHGVAVRCLWLRTSLQQAQLNAATRIVQRYGRLLEPEELRKLSRADPNAFAPSAQFRYRRELEPPRPEEGFVEIEELDFERDPPPARSGRAVFFEPREEGIRPKLDRYEGAGFRLLGVSFQPGRRDRTYVDSGVEVHLCNHPPPISCWCRKPLPGLGVVLIEKYGLAPEKCLVVVSSPADKGFAERLGIPALAASELEP